MAVAEVTLGWKAAMMTDSDATGSAAAEAVSAP